MATNRASELNSVEEVQLGLLEVGYLATTEIATVLFLAQELGKPILVEGPAGTGKTELAKAFAAMTGVDLIRLQCYEGLDANSALYEWDYASQLLKIQQDRSEVGKTWQESKGQIFSEEFLLERPVLAAVKAGDSLSLIHI